MKSTFLVILFCSTIVGNQCYAPFSSWRGGSGEQAPSVKSNSASQFASEESGSTGKVRNFVGWLTSSSNANYQEHSDVKDAEASEMENWRRLSRYNAEGEAGLSSPINSLVKKGRQYFSATNLIRSGYESIVGISGCLMGQSFNDPIIGSIDQNASYYCDFRCGRMIPGLTCCSPQSPDLIDTKLLLFRKGRETEYLDWSSAEDGDILKNETKVVFVAHGYLEKISFSQWITDLTDGYVQLGYAVIVIDWRGGNSLQYWQAAANVRTVGATIAHAIGTWGIADKTLFVGFSLGGQMIAETSKYLKRIFNQQIDECHGLDPAGPFFDGCDESMMLDKSSCRLVQVIHTSAGDFPVIDTAAVRFGSYKKSGHCDYWVNCGHNQGPCIELDFLNFTKSLVRLAMASDAELMDWAANRLCSHWRAPNIYVSALTGRKTCPAVLCPKCGRFSHFCTPANGTGPVGDDVIPPFSKCTPDDDVNYYVDSSSYAPYCRY